ncbi:MAG: hypothetical protein HY814_07555, partial [Candidatus Riflebacteria bacterium]|nr:hypothetical protein [Candidatus Riflebacteria bacterium]
MPADAHAQLDDLLATGQVRLAVELTKEWHRGTRTSESEDLLILAYRARIAGLRARGLTAEAQTLEAQVRERHTQAWNRLPAANEGLTCRFPSLDEALRPLADPALPPDERARLESRVGALLTWPDQLARSDALPPDHPLRLAAARVQAAFDAAVAGPVDEALVALPEVHRRSPLAPWKMLVRALACFYRYDDEACRQALASIAPATAPARLVPVMTAMLEGHDGSGLGPSAARLAGAVRQSSQPLREALAAADKALGHGHPNVIIRELRNVMTVCREVRPELEERLKQHLYIKATEAGAKSDPVRLALGGPVRQDAAFLALMASSAESAGNLPVACAEWASFVREAVSEGQFAEASPEAAAVHAHLASLLSPLSSSELRHLQILQCFVVERREDGLLVLSRVSRRTPSRQKTGRARDDLWDPENEPYYYLYPAMCLKRACQADPSTENFQAWTKYLGRLHGQLDALEAAARAWQEAFPSDPRPSLIVMEELERGGRYEKALALQAKAEMLDALDPAIRQARLRLLMAVCLRDLRGKRTSTTAAALDELASLPACAHGDARAVPMALRLVHDARAGRAALGAENLAELTALLGHPAAAWGLAWSVAVDCKLGKTVKFGPAPEVRPEEPFLRGVARAAAAMAGAGLDLRIPKDWRDVLTEACEL